MIQEPIFKDNSKKEKLGSSILSFKDCPNHCIDGYYVDPYQHRRKKCLYCEERRKNLAKEEIQLDGDNSIKKLLNLPESYVGYGSFNIATIIPENQQTRMKADSLSLVSDTLSNLLNSISAGVASENSLLINLGLNAYPCNFIYAYLMRAYISGLTVSPYLTARDVFLMLEYETEGIDENVLDLGDNVVIKYKDLLNTDVCVVHITTGANYSHVRAVKGLMQMRAHNNKSTIIFTDAWWFNSESVSERYLKFSLQSLYDTESQSKAVAKLIKVSYIYDENSVDKVKREPKSQMKSNGSFAEMSQSQLNAMFSSNNKL